METTKSKFNFINVLAISILFLSFGYLFITRNSPETPGVIAVRTFLLSTIMPTIVFFYFGSSKSSQKKDETIQTLQAAAATPPPAPEKKEPVVPVKVEGFQPEQKSEETQL